MPPGHEYPIQAPPAPAAAPAPREDWVHRHPYLATTIALLGLILIGIGIVGSRSGVSRVESGNNWVGTGSIFSTGGQRMTEAERLSAGEVVKSGSSDVELGYIPITSPLEGIVEETGQSAPNDLAELLALLSKPGPSSPDINLETSSAFSFIPEGLISVATRETNTSPEAEALFSYGNTVGTYIQGFESSHTYAIQILKDHAEDRGNADKAAQVERLGYDIAELGRDLGLIEGVPDSVKAAHSALATSYRIVGTNLTKVATAATDEEFLEAITTYNASVESLSKRFFVVVGIFSANNVAFTSGDAGSIFTFNATPSF